MDPTLLNTTVDNIQLQEQENEEKLKQKRKLQDEISSINCAIRDTKRQIDKLNHELTEIAVRVDKTRLELDLKKINNISLSAQVEHSSKESDKLRTELEEKFSKILEIRNSFCTAVQQGGNEWDIQALLTKHVRTEKPKENKKQIDDDFNNEEKLKEAKKKLENIIKERDRLMKEPENGEEFIRIKTALRYSEEIITKLKNYSTKQ